MKVILALGAILKPMNHKHLGFEVAGRTHNDNVFLDLDTPNMTSIAWCQTIQIELTSFFTLVFSHTFSFEVQWARDHWGPLLYNVPIKLHSRIQPFWPFRILKLLKGCSETFVKKVSEQILCVVYFEEHHRTFPIGENLHNLFQCCCG